MAKSDELTKVLLIQTSAGLRRNPLVSIAARAAADMVEYAAHLGMTAATRGLRAASPSRRQEIFRAVEVMDETRIIRGWRGRVRAP